MGIKDVNRRAEDVNKRVEGLRYYVDRRVGLLEELIVSFDIPILAGLMMALIKLFA